KESRFGIPDDRRVGKNGLEDRIGVCGHGRGRLLRVIRLSIVAGTAGYQKQHNENVINRHGFNHKLKKHDHCCTGTITPSASTLKVYCPASASHCLTTGTIRVRRGVTCC